ncbi:MAG TPA: hypothetical protein VNX47_13560 [Nevskia sp.]|jgi:hypothetical protein|nr:hypothetical protein [Nevskia sp.]
MTQAERFSLATHLYVRLRRSSGRVVDAVWMAQNDEYANEILRLAANDPDPETQNLVQRFQSLIGGRPAARKPAPPPARQGAAEAESAQHYIGTLR